MAENMGKWPSGHGQLTKIRPPEGYGGKTITTAAQSGYDRHGLEGYLGNVGLRGLRRDQGRSHHLIELLPKRIARAALPPGSRVRAFFFARPKAKGLRVTIVYHSESGGVVNLFLCHTETSDEQYRH